MRADRAVNQGLGPIYDFCLHRLLHFPHSLRRGRSGKGSPKNLSKNSLRFGWGKAIRLPKINPQPPEPAPQPVAAASTVRGLPPPASSPLVLPAATAPGKATARR